LPARRTTGRQKASAPIPISAFSIKTFCRSHGDISEAMFHKMCAAGEGPVVMAIGRRRAISIEAAAKWREQREAVAREANKAKAKQTENA
jgi:hypothetical protein